MIGSIILLIYSYNMVEASTTNSWFGLSALFAEIDFPYGKRIGPQNFWQTEIVDAPPHYIYMESKKMSFAIFLNWIIIGTIPPSLLFT